MPFADYSAIDKDITEKKTVSKHVTHWWYFSEKLLCLSLFDSTISLETKDVLRVEILDLKKNWKQIKKSEC